MYESEEAKVINSENSTDVLVAFNKIPYSLISSEVDGSSSSLLSELDQICKYYDVYNQGSSFAVEGANGDYVPATLHYKLAASLINKEARFLFAEAPSITIVPKADAGKVTSEAKSSLTNYNELVRTILDKNAFEEALIKAARDCFIGKRILGLVNFNEEDGVSVSFLPSTQFIFETKPGNTNVLTKVVCFIIIKESASPKERRIFKKKFSMEDDGYAYLQEVIYDGAGGLIEEITEYQATKLTFIPARVFLNDGLTGDLDGESEIEGIAPFDSWYSKMACGDLDSERKSMNPIRYTIDMDSKSTKGLSSSAGSFWDLLSDQNLDNANPQVGTLENQMSYSESLKTSLERVKMAAYDQLDIPNVNLETMVGSVTSGKALKAVYWPLIVRCKEKMKMWGPGLRSLTEIIIEGSKVYPNCIKKYIGVPLVPTDYTIKVEQNIPIPEDESEEKTSDLSEVESQVMSRKTYMKKWRELSDADANDELKQIALERQILEDSFSVTPPTNANDLSSIDSSSEEENDLTL